MWTAIDVVCLDTMWLVLNIFYPTQTPTYIINSYKCLYTFYPTQMPTYIISSYKCLNKYNVSLFTTFYWFKLLTICNWHGNTLTLLARFADVVWFYLQMVLDKNYISSPITLYDNGALVRDKALSHWLYIYMVYQMCEVRLYPWMFCISQCHVLYNRALLHCFLFVCVVLFTVK